MRPTSVGLIGLGSDEDAAIVALTGAEGAMATQTRAARVLVTDDEPIAHMLMKLLLEIRVNAVFRRLPAVAA